MYSTNLIGNHKKIIHVSLKFVIECVRARTKIRIYIFSTLIHTNKHSTEQNLLVEFKTFLDVIAITDVKICECYKAILLK